LGTASSHTIAEAPFGLDIAAAGVVLDPLHALLAVLRHAFGVVVLLFRNRPCLEFVAEAGAPDVEETVRIACVSGSHV